MSGLLDDLAAIMTAAAHDKDLELVALMGGEALKQSRSELVLAPTVPMAPQTPRLPGVRVLLVDDSDTNLELAKRILEHDGAVVHLARDGQEALDRLQGDPDGVDIVLMDLQMPRLDGCTATRRLRADGLKNESPSGSRPERRSQRKAPRMAFPSLRWPFGDLDNGLQPVIVCAVKFGSRVRPPVAKAAHSPTGRASARAPIRRT